MNDLFVPQIIFDDKDINELVDLLRYSFEKSQKAFAKMCYAVYFLSKRFDNLIHVSTNSGVLYNKLEFFALFGMNSNSVHRFCKCYLKFVDDSDTDVGINLKSFFFGFTPSKLYELIPVENEQLEKDLFNGKLTASMTVNQIRNYVNSLKSSDKVDSNSPGVDLDVSQLEMTFDPCSLYSVEFFESKSKDELIHFCLEYQKKYVKG